MGPFDFAAQGRPVPLSQRLGRFGDPGRQLGVLVKGP